MPRLTHLKVPLNETEIRLRELHKEYNSRLIKEKKILNVAKEIIKNIEEFRKRDPEFFKTVFERFVHEKTLAEYQNKNMRKRVKKKILKSGFKGNKKEINQEIFKNIKKRYTLLTKELFNLKNITNEEYALRLMEFYYFGLEYGISIHAEKTRFKVKQRVLNEFEKINKTRKLTPEYVERIAEDISELNDRNLIKNHIRINYSELIGRHEFFENIELEVRKKINEKIKKEILNDLKAIILMQEFLEEKHVLRKKPFTELTEEEKKQISYNFFKHNKELREIEEKIPSKVIKEYNKEVESIKKHNAPINGGFDIDGEKFFQQLIENETITKTTMQEIKTFFRKKTKNIRIETPKTTTTPKTKIKRTIEIRTVAKKPAKSKIKSTPQPKPKIKPTPQPKPIEKKSTIKQEKSSKELFKKKLREYLNETEATKVINFLKKNHQSSLDVFLKKWRNLPGRAFTISLENGFVQEFGATNLFLLIKIINFFKDEGKNRGFVLRELKNREPWKTREIQNIFNWMVKKKLLIPHTGQKVYYLIRIPQKRK